MSSSIDPALLHTYGRDGFVRVPELLNASESAVISEQVTRILFALPADQPLDRLLNWHLKADELLQLALHPMIMRYVHALLGPDVALFNTRLMVKSADTGRAVGWHQDIAYFPLDPPQVVTLWLALDPVNEDNSPLLATPGCHRSGIYPHKAVATGETFGEAIDAEACRLGEPTVLTLPQGGAILMDGFTPHASPPNRSAIRRTTFIARYISTHTRLHRDRRALYGPDYPLLWISGHSGVNHYVNSTPALDVTSYH